MSQISINKPFLQGFIERYIWKPNTELRHYDSPPIGSPNSYIPFYNNMSTSGVNVNERNALSIPAYFRACKILEDTIASFPWQTFKRTKNGKEVDRSHYMYRLLHDSPNPLMTSYTFRKIMIGNAIQTGNGIARIVRDNKGRVVSLDVWDNKDRIYVGLSNGDVWYAKQGENGMEVYSSDEIFHIMFFTRNGYEGISLLDYAKDNLGNAIAGQERSGNLYRTGALISGVFHAGRNLKDETRALLREEFKKYSNGGSDSGGVMVLSTGEEFTPIQMSPKDAQYLESMKFSVSDVSRWTGVPLHLLSDLERATHSNIEHQNIHFHTYTILPWAVQIEQEIQRKVFNQDSDKSYFSEFNFDGLLRADSASRGQMYKARFETASITPNEIRAKENDNPIEGGNDAFAPLNYMTLRKHSEYSDSLIHKDNATPKE